MTDQVTHYGFQWGPMEVERSLEYRGVRVVRLKTDKGRTLEVAVSPTGQSVRVWLDGKKMETHQ